MIPQPKINKTLEENFSKNAKPCESNIQVNGIKVVYDLNELNNNKDLGRVNDAYVADYKL